MEHPNVVTHHIEREEFHIDARYTDLKHIGRGAYGIVVEAFDKVTKSKVSIKLIKNVFRDTLEAKRLLRELKLLCHFRGHDNIVRIQNVMTYPPTRHDFDVLYLVTQLYECDLQRIINSKQPLTDGHIEYFIYQILKGLKYIHSAKVLHRDLKPANILVNADCSLAICDFGLSRSIADPNPNLTEYVVTRWYRAPEILAGAADYDYTVDIWSVGCILGELLNTEALFRGNSFADQLRLIVTALGRPSEEVLRTFPETAAHAIREMTDIRPINWAEKFRGKSEHLIDLLTKMLVIDPKKRISIDDALNHPAFKSVKVPESEIICPLIFGGEFERACATDLDKKMLQKEFLAEILELRSWQNRSSGEQAKRQADENATLHQKLPDPHNHVGTVHPMHLQGSKASHTGSTMEGIEESYAPNGMMHGNGNRYSRYAQSTQVNYAHRMDDEVMGDYNVPTAAVNGSMQPPYHTHQAVGHPLHGHIPTHYGANMAIPDMGSVPLIGYGGHHATRESSFPNAMHGHVYGNGPYNVLPEDRSAAYSNINGQHYHSGAMPMNTMHHARPQVPGVNDAHIQMSEDTAAMFIPQSVAIQHAPGKHEPAKTMTHPLGEIQPAQPVTQPADNALKNEKSSRPEGPILAGPINVPGSEFVRYNPLFARYYTAAMITHFTRIEDIHKRQFANSSSRPPYSVQWVPLLVNTDGEPVDMKDAIREIEKNGLKCMGAPTKEVAMLHSVFQKYVHTIFPADTGQ